MERNRKMQREVTKSKSRTPSKRHTPTIAILLFDGVEVLDFAGPYEVFSAASDDKGNPHATIFCISEHPQVRCRGGLRVISDATLNTRRPFDLLIVPGGPGAREKTGKQAVLTRFLQKQKKKGKLIASVCTGSFLLARAGLLDGRRATTHTARLDNFATEFSSVHVQAKKIVDEGDLITAGGVASGIDLALYLLEQWFGPEAKKREARRLDGPW